MRYQTATATWSVSGSHHKQSLKHGITVRGEREEVMKKENRKREKRKSVSWKHRSILLRQRRKKETIK